MSTKVLNENVDEIAEKAVVTLIDNLFKEIAYIDVDTVRKNIGLASNGGMSQIDRTIRIEVANYLMKHFAIIYLGLVINENFRNEFIRAIQLEMGMDNTDDSTKASLRKKMQHDPNAKSKGDYVVDFSTYSDAAYSKINKKLLLSMESVSEFDDGFDMFSAKLSQNDMVNIGFIVSNFMYLLRACGKNAIFMAYVKDVVRSVEASIEGE